ncbi:unnamed protein product [Ostreobium quekettii]|uniref:Pre-rRNA-processing protein Ipi1 N-terminal domain-containing protein n=1 Tax=Ostreobium quekettii TaxID=121088 RepID=A0A8S1IRT9_9CHLO|nr:unnamed protein product [Ostreobium quekettii]|eukprot:evm.model.scf_986.5 EVM.evm.TU.scf_986.5   scf_986:30610-39509(+)
MGRLSGCRRELGPAAAMGIGRKRKNRGVGVDFYRAKHKVGKKLKKANNATDTTIKSRTIGLPEQSIAQDKDGAAVSKRNLTLKELLSQLSHYSAKVRRDAMEGMGQLFEANPGELNKHAAAVVEGIGERCTDNDGRVRTTLLRLMSKWVLPLLGVHAFRPFLPLLMAHICSAMTHLEAGVRNDSLRFLDLVVKHQGASAMTEFLTPCLEYFTDLLTTLSRSHSLQMASQANKLKVLSGLNKFLGTVLGLDKSPGALCVNSGHSRESSTLRTLFSFRCQQGPKPVMNRSSWGLEQQENAPKATAASICWDPTKHQRSPAVAARGLLERLLDVVCSHSSILADMASGTADLASTCSLVEALQSVAFLVVWLKFAKAIEGSSSFLGGTQISSVGNVGGNQLEHKCGEVVRRFSSVFPICCSVTGLPEAREAVTKFNLVMATLAGRFAKDQVQEGTAADSSKQLRDFYVGALEDIVTNPLHSNIDTEAMIQNVLPSMGITLPMLRVTDQHDVLTAFTKWFQALAVTSPAKLSCLKFMLLLLKGNTHPGHSRCVASEEIVREWAHGLPRLLWEAGHKHTHIFEAAAQLLHSLARYCTPAISTDLDKLQVELVPLFWTRAPGKRPSASSLRKSRTSSKIVVPGPLARLPKRVQLLATSVLYFLPSLCGPLVRSCLIVSLMAAYPAETAQSFITIVSKMAEDGRAKHDDVRVLISGLISGQMDPLDVSDADSTKGDWQRHQLQVDGGFDLMWSLRDLCGTKNSLMPRVVDPWVRLASEAVDCEDRRNLFGIQKFLLQAAQAGMPDISDAVWSSLPTIMVKYHMALHKDGNPQTKGLDDCASQPMFFLLLQCRPGLMPGVLKILFEELCSLRPCVVSGFCPSSFALITSHTQVLLDIFKCRELAQPLLRCKHQIVEGMAHLEFIASRLSSTHQAERKSNTLCQQLLAVCEHVVGSGQAP